MKKKRVAILTWHYYPNFGSVLQAYALQRQLNTLGYDAVLIDYRNRKYGTVSSGRELLVYILGKMFPSRFSYPFIHFRKERLTLSHLVQDEDELSSVVQTYDAVLCGSDQIWAPSVYNPVYLLDFVPDRIPKISYAASIGLNDIPDEMTDIYYHLLSRFVRVSVREKKGAELLKKKCGIEAQIMIDPTLLIDASQWIELETKTLQYENYIFCYFLNNDHSYKESVQQFANNHGLRIVGCSTNPADESWMERPCPKVGPCEFLWLIRHASCIFTDSYHGTIFSLLFHKEFVTFERFLETDDFCQNSRIYQLAESFGISARIMRVTEGTVLSVTDYDYDVFENSLAMMRKNAIEFLANALESC